MTAVRQLLHYVKTDLTILSLLKLCWRFSKNVWFGKSITP